VISVDLDAGGVTLLDDRAVDVALDRLESFHVPVIVGHAALAEVHDELIAAPQEELLDAQAPALLH